MLTLKYNGQCNIINIFEHSELNRINNILPQSGRTTHYNMTFSFLSQHTVLNRFLIPYNICSKVF